MSIHDCDAEPDMYHGIEQDSCKDQQVKRMEPGSIQRLPPRSPYPAPLLATHLLLKYSGLKNSMEDTVVRGIG